MEAAASSSWASDDDHGGIIQASESRRGFSVAGRESDERRNSIAIANDGYQQHAQYRAPQPPRRWGARVAQKVKQWLFVYNVTTGLYMLDWWERCIFNAVFVVLFAVVGYNSGHYLQRMGASLLAWAWAWRAIRAWSLPGLVQALELRVSDELGFGDGVGDYGHFFLQFVNRGLPQHHGNAFDILGE